MDFLSDDTIERFQKRHQNSPQGEPKKPPLSDQNSSAPLNIERTLGQTRIEFAPKNQDFDRYSERKSTHSNNGEFSESKLRQTKSQEFKKHQHHREFLKKSLGDIENVRLKLGLSQRKMGELLMVDPSSWNRWLKNPDSIPSSIYQSLFWYLQLRKLNVTDQNVSYEQFEGYVRQQDSINKVRGAMTELEQRILNSESLNRQYSMENTSLKNEIEKLRFSMRLRTYLMIFFFTAALMTTVVLTK